MNRDSMLPQAPPPVQAQANPVPPPTPATDQARDMATTKINIQMTIAEANQLLQVLQTGPYGTVKPLIEMIMSQAQAQSPVRGV